jgi:hypothetical protein
MSTNVPRKVAVPGASVRVVNYPAASRIPIGAAVAFSSATAGAETVAAAEAETSILGFAGNREFVPKGAYDGFLETYEPVDIVDGYANALVMPNGTDTNIDIGDFLEIAVLGDGTPGPHGLLEEAGSSAGTVFTIATVAKALETVTMGSKSYKIPAASVAVGDTTITMTAGHIATMGIKVGDYIYLEDITGAGQLNRVAGLTSTVITLEVPSTVVLTYTDSDLVTRCYPCLVKVVK